LLLLALAPACSFTEPTAPLRPALPIPAKVAERFAVPPVREVHLAEPSRRDDLAVREGCLEVAGRIVRFSLFLPAKGDGPHPLIVCIPILAAGRSILLRIATDLAHRGFATAFLEREGRIFRRNESPADLEERLSSQVVDHRAFLAWCSRRPELDPDRVGIVGLSLGGILGGVLVAVEPRIKAASLCLSGGDLPSILTDTGEGRIVDWARARAAAGGLTASRLEDELRSSLRSDPSLLGAHVDPRRVFMVTASFDGVVPERNSELLWESLGRPKRLVVPLGHYSAAFVLDFVLREVETFSRERFR
jgi:hypothetical protein